MGLRVESRKEVHPHVVAVWMAFTLAEVEFLLTSDTGFISKLLKENLMGQKTNSVIRILCTVTAQELEPKVEGGVKRDIWHFCYLIDLF